MKDARHQKLNGKIKRILPGTGRPGMSILFLSLVVFVASAHAGPTGGEIVGGAGSIGQSGANTTTINQTSQNMAINWQSYNVGTNERVQYIQPNSSSISLNRILSQNGSTIAGRIDANGQVILVNPNGIFFTPTSIINVGGIIASGLNIQPNDFMNGNYIFDEVLGTDGTVINSGIINASLGGNVAFIGKQVENDGLIVANLGMVSLAAGKQAVLTFDDGGLLGVRISKEILQEELGVDLAVLNSGEINAEGGRVLLTASTSQDVFSQAVNTGDLDQATSVVMHEDGSFTLGSGADVINTGSIDTSTTSSYLAVNDQNLSPNTGRIVLLGENVTSSGELLANANTGNGGDIELHAQNTTLLTENSITSARSESNGQGGVVKVLGDRVGLFDQSIIDVSGANSGGQALVGGDFQGKNPAIRNATATIINEGTTIYADALVEGDGGKVIVWADGNTFFAGDISVRGGEIAGDGGLIETSGKENLIFRGNTDRTARNGEAGLLLLDPRNITIGTATDNDSALNDKTVNFGDHCDTTACNDSDDDMSISAGKLQSELTGGDVLLQANQDIIIQASVTTTSSVVRTLILQAGDDITTNAGTAFNLGNDNLVMIAGSSDCGSSCQDSNFSGNIFEGGNIRLRGTIDTSGSLILHAADNIWIDNAIGGTTAPSSIVLRAGNSIETRTNTFPDPDAFGAITSNGDIILMAADSLLTSDSLYPTVERSQFLTGNIILQHDVTTGDGNFTATTTEGYFNNEFTDQNLNAGTGTVTIQANGTDATAGTFLGNITAGSLSVTTTDGQIIQSTTASQNLAITGESAFNAGSNLINLQNDSNDLSGTISLITTDSNNAILNNNATTTTLGTTAAGALDVGGDLTVNADQSLTLADTVIVGGVAELNFAQDNTDGNTFTTSAGLTFAANITVSGSNGQDIFDITSSMEGQLNGNAGNDTFNINGATLAISELRGGADNDTLTGFDSANIWTITTANGGSLDNDGQTTAFSEMETLNGALNSDDSFVYEVTPTTANMTIEGRGQTGQDSVNLASLVGPVSVQLGETTFSSIEQITGNNTDSTLIGSNAGETWEITAENSGNIDGTLNFIDFNNLTGGTGDDTFDLGANVTGTVDGGEGSDTFNIIASITGLLNGNTGNDTFNINNPDLRITSLVGGAGSDTLNGFDSANTWTITAANGGSLDNDGQTTAFSEMETLNGGNDRDGFSVIGSGAISGMIDGGGGPGINTLTGRNTANIWTIDGTNSLVETNAGVYINTFSNIDTLTGGNAVDTFDITTAFTGNINGGDNNDIFNLNANVSDGVDGNAGNDIFNINATINGTLNGNDGNDTFNVESDGITATIAGGTGGTNSDTVTGFDSANTNTWTINSDGGGNLQNTSGTNLTFTEIENTTGGTGNDTFNVNAALSSITTGNGNNNITVNSNGNVTGAITGGTGIDTLDIIGSANTISTGENDDIITVSGTVSGVIDGGGAQDILTITSASAQIVQLSATDLDAGENFNVTGVETINALNSDVNNILRADIGTNAWEVDVDNGGRIINSGATIGFMNFANLEGNAGVDNFTVDAQINSINAGEGVNEITVGSAGRMTGSLITGTNNDTINVEGVVNSIIAGDGINIINISGSATSITSGNGNDIYNISGNASSINADDGVNDISITTTGSISGALTTGAGNDTINIAGIVDGAINGGAGGDDTLTITTAGDQIIQLGTVDSGTENFTVNNIETIDVTNFATGNILRADESRNVWFVNTDNNGTVRDLDTGTIVIFSNVAHLVGNSDADTFNINAAITSINAGAGTNNVIVNGNINGTLITGAGNDTININAGGTAASINVGNGTNSITVVGSATDLTGGTGIDTITVTGSVNAIDAGDGNDNINISGTVADVIDGGSGIADLLTIVRTGDQTVQLGNSRVGDENYTVTNIETINATGTSGNTLGNTLIADAGPNTWVINGNNSGFVTDNTTASTLSVINASSGAININNTGNVIINDLRNYGDITLTNDGNITLNVTSSSGAIDANYGGSINDFPYAGSVTLSALDNNFSTLGVGTGSGNADIIAENLYVNDVSKFGTQDSPVGLRVNNEFRLSGSVGAVYYLGDNPRSVITDGGLVVVPRFPIILGQQLINVENLSEIDPAIFSEVRNYNYGDVAIQLPVDQGYGDDDEKEKNQKADEQKAR